MKMKKAKNNHKINPARHNFSINLGITKGFGKKTVNLKTASFQSKIAQ